MVKTIIDGIECNTLNHNLGDFKTKRSTFVLLLAYSETSSIPGITIAGADTDLVKYTPAADAEYIHFGKCKCIETIPATPDGKPTPAIITKTALEISNLPIMVVDSGSIIKPSLPHINIQSTWGKNILLDNALNMQQVQNNYENGQILGKQLAKLNDVVILGESIPGGTTTALGVLQAIGINAFDKMSSSMPINPHIIKNKVVEKSLLRSNLEFGECVNDPFKAISCMGDPFMPTIVGMAEEIISYGKKVILAGGTQMCCILALLKSLDVTLNNNICIGTTSYLLNDRQADPIGLIKQISDIPVFYVDINLEQSKLPGLKAYSEGFVKEGAGAGGTTLFTLLNNDVVNPKYFMNMVEQNYETTIKPNLVNN